MANAAVVPEYLSPASRVELNKPFLKSIATNALTGGFGVTGDGTTEDTTAIQDAISGALGSKTNRWNGYHVLYFPGGAAGVKRIYSVNNFSASGFENLYIIGDGDASVIQQVNGGFVGTFSDGTHVRISDIAFDANGTVNSYGGFRFYRAAGLIIERAHFYDSASVGFDETNDRYAFTLGDGGTASTDVVLRHCVVEDLQVEIDNVERVLAEFNTFLRGPTTAQLGFFALQSSVLAKFHDITVRHNKFIDARNRNLQFSIDGLNAESATFRNINVYDNKFLQHNRGATGIRFGAGNLSWVIPDPPTFEDIRIEGNEFEYDQGALALNDSACLQVLSSGPALNNYVYNRVTVGHNKIITPNDKVTVPMDLRFLTNSKIDSNEIYGNSYYGIIAGSCATTVSTRNIVESYGEPYRNDNEGAGNTFTENQYAGWPITLLVGGGDAPAKVGSSKLPVVASANLRGTDGTQAQEATLIIEDGGTDNANLIFAYAGKLYRLDGGSPLVNLVTTVVDDNAYNSFPGIAEFPSGSPRPIIVVYRTATNHFSSDGVIKHKISSDGGLTWAAAVTITDPAFDARDAGVTLLANGTLLMSYFEMPVGYAYTRIGTITGSTVSWAAKVLACDDFDNGGGAHAVCSAPPLQLANGDVLLPVYGFNGVHATAGVVISTDSGVSWPNPGIAIANDPTNIDYSEPNLVQLTNGDVVAMIRNEILQGYSRSVSTDNGATWSAVANVINIGAYTTGRPAFTLLANGNLFMFTRMGGLPDSRGGTTISTDDGVTWSAFLTYSAERFEYAGLTHLNSGRIGAAVAREHSGTDCYIVFQPFTAEGVGIYN